MKRERERERYVVANEEGRSARLAVSSGLTHTHSGVYTAHTHTYTLHVLCIDIRNYKADFNFDILFAFCLKAEQTRRSV